MKQLSRISRFI